MMHSNRSRCQSYGAYDASKLQKVTLVPKKTPSEHHAKQPPRCVLQRAASLPTNLAHVNQSSKKLFWFRPKKADRSIPSGSRHRLSRSAPPQEIFARVSQNGIGQPILETASNSFDSDDVTAGTEVDELNHFDDDESLLGVRFIIY